MNTLVSSRLLAITFSSVFAVACSSATQETGTTAANSRNTGDASRSGGSGSSGGANLASHCDVSPVYFAYDSSELDGSARSALEQGAECLSRSSARNNVTGMTDPRGTEEYNLALGDRRARTVVGYLGNMGVESSRMNVHSVGEEMAGGQDESGWARDRRAEISAR